MNTFDRIKSDLDNLSSNEERKKYLEDIRKDPSISRHDLRRLVVNIMDQDSFIDKYYGFHNENYFKKLWSKFINLF